MDFAFFSFPRFGHIRPVLAVARELTDRGHRVSFVVAEQFAGAVAETGAEAIPYPSTFPASVPQVRTADELAAVVVEYLHEGFAALPAAWAAFADRRFDLVVEDALSTAVSRLTAERTGAPVARFFPGFAGNDEVPLNGSEPEPDGPRLDAEHPTITAYQTELLASLRPYGLDTVDVERIRTGGEIAANLIFVPRAFQPRAECFDSSFHFVGPVFADEPVTTPWRRDPDAAKVVLVSLGTSSNSNPGFFRECAEAFAGTGWQVVMTTGGHLDPHTPLPGLVELHDWVDFAALLPEVDVVVCQAGTGTLMDAFRFGAGVVTVPQQPDARVIAEHVEWLGLGRALLGGSAGVTGAAVRDAALAVAADPMITRRVEWMRTAIRSAGGAQAAADVLERAAAWAVPQDARQRESR